MSKKNHPFHLVSPSPWPFVGSIGGLVSALGLILFMHNEGSYVLIAGLSLILATMGGWWWDVIQESKKKEDYTSPVQFGLKMGMVLFILSEVMFFAAFFGAFFYTSLFPTGGVWPPQGVHPLNPFDFPYFNTLILLLSGTTLTWAHHALLENHRKDVLKGLGVTIALGLLFSCIQIYEYAHASFGFKEGIYPSIFYMTTGFHGVHVFVGTLFLAVCWLRTYAHEFTPTRHIGFEAAAWYWHFVDVVWLLLFVSIYWWGSGFDSPSLSP